MNPPTLTTPTSAETQVKNRLLSTSSSGAVTPTDPNIAALTGSYDPQSIMDRYASAKTLTEQGADATAKRLNSEYGTAVEDTNIADTKSNTQTFEGQRGFAQMPVALNYMQASHDKRIKDLTKQKDELLMSNDANKAKSLSDLIIKEQDAMTTARTNFLSNFFNASSYETPDQKSARTLNDTQKQGTLSLMQTAPSAGILPTDDYQTAIKKYQSSTEYRQNIRKGELELSKIQSEINKNNTSNTSTSGNLPGSASNLSPAAQNILKIINSGGGDVETLIKGSGKEAQALRNEVYAGLAEQGGRSANVYALMTDAQDIVNDMMTNKDYKPLGGYSSTWVGNWSTDYGDASAKAQQLGAILARDNLGLLKGAMSDKDMEFIKSMSTGFEGLGTQSEKYIKERLETIQTKLADKLKDAPASMGGPSVSSSTSKDLMSAPATSGQTATGIKWTVTP